MRVSSVAIVAAATALGGYGLAQAPRHLNPMVDLHAAGQPVFGLYAPSNPRSRPPGTAPAGPSAPSADAAAPPARKTAAELAREGLAYAPADFLFDGGMEHDFDRGFAAFGEFARAVATAGPRAPDGRLRPPLVVKTPEVAPDTALAKQRIARQLDLGVSTIVFVGVESPAELHTGLAAMRYRAAGGTRPDGVGAAPAMWGVSDAEYRRRADVWPLNPRGDLTAWAIVESKPGLARVREIAAVKGITVLFPGAGTLRGVFTTVDSATGVRTFDPAQWEAAIQQVLSACKEFKVPCGYPANDPQMMALRMKQGFSVFVSGWGDSGFRAVESGRKTAGR